MQQAPGLELWAWRGMLVSGWRELLDMAQASTWVAAAQVNAISVSKMRGKNPAAGIDANPKNPFSAI
jgi:hypothetical protein